MPRIVFCALVTGALILGVSSLAAEQGVTPPDRPVEVSIGLYLIDVTNIDEARNTFDVEVDVIASWRDPRLAFEGEEPRILVGQELDEFRRGIWTAQGMIVNSVGQPTFGIGKLVVFPDGTLRFTNRMNATARSSLDYRRFPFDKQVLQIHVESFAWNSDLVHLTADEGYTGYAPGFDLPEWRITDYTSSNVEIQSPRDPVTFSRLTFSLALERKSGFFMWKIFLTVWIIVALSWVVFWMSDERLGRRAGISTTGILTVIAYQFVTSSTLPRVSYLTVADRIMVVSMVFIALAMVESIVVDHLEQRDKARKVAVDRTCRWAFPVAYFAVMIFLAVNNGLLG